VTKKSPAATNTMSGVSLPIVMKLLTIAVSRIPRMLIAARDVTTTVTTAARPGPDSTDGQK
jgi:hypothetical protein